MEVRDDTVWDGATPVATLVPSAHGGGAVSLQLLAALVVDREVATSLVAALTTARIPVLDVGDELVRHAAARGEMDRRVAGAPRRTRVAHS